MLSEKVIYLSKRRREEDIYIRFKSTLKSEKKFYSKVMSGVHQISENL